MNLNDKRNLKTRRTKLADMPIGSRFMMHGHSSLMIATDMVQSSKSGRMRLVVSENGLSEWVKETEIFTRMPNTVIYEFSGLSNKIVKGYIDEVANESKTHDGLSSSTKISSPLVIECLNKSIVEVMVNYINNEVLGDDPISKFDARNTTLLQFAEHMDKDKLLKYEGFGTMSMEKIYRLLEKVGAISTIL
jgi:hypothetical protein